MIQVGLPVHALGNRLNDQVAPQELLHVFFVVGLLDECCVFCHTEWRRLELFETFNRAGDDAVLGPFFCSQIKQHDRDFAIDQMRSNLRAHHARAQHGNFFYGEFLHFDDLRVSPGDQANASSVSIRDLAPLRAVRISDAVSGNSLAK